MTVPSTDATQWIFSPSVLLATPSSSSSSFPLSKELYDRARGVEFLYRLGSSLQLPTTALCTAATWFHRFYMRYSMEDYHRQDVAATCIFLATKTEECGRKLRDIARVFQSKVNYNVPIEAITKEAGSEVEQCQSNILATEEALLEALCFDFVVSSVHEVLVDLFEEHTEDEVVQEVAWCIAHDSYRTVLCVLFGVRIIAAACFILAQRMVAGPHSASLDARICASAPSASLLTPPSNKPRSPDATRFAIEHLQFSEDELRDLSEALTILLEFYVAQEVQLNVLPNFLAPLTTVQPPASSPNRTKLYVPYIQAATASNGAVRTDQKPDLNDRTPDSSHGGNSPAKVSSSSGWVPVTGEVKESDGSKGTRGGRLDLS
ncbi:cyclin-like protein [Rickenella mellea]|uniref:Cyclin-like protein n=1 Tax=Rickenella mellea TaxID=50990 RepID=A0A4Y7QII6_9AGAM|nr:cyclin-like protein [Rickenella mellea]